MRHRKTFNHLSRKTGHRKAMFANMASSLILHKRIKTTTAKAKALRMFVEPLITKTKGLDSIAEKMHAQRVVFSYLRDKKAVHELFFKVAPKVENRDGGYTRIIKIGNRLGDNADMCLIELVDYNETMLAEKDHTQKGASRRRRRRGGSGTAKKAQETKTDQESTAEEKPEAIVEEQSEKAPEEIADAKTDGSIEEKPGTSENTEEKAEEAKAEEKTEEKAEEKGEEKKNEAKDENPSEEKEDKKEG